MIERRQRRRRGLASTGSIGKYTLHDAIRVQPNRALYASYDPFLDREVVIKIIQLFDPSSDKQANEDEAFFAEARAIGRLQHQNIVSVYDAGIGDYEGYIVMQCVQGESLLQKLKAVKNVSIELAITIAVQICRALEYSHQQQVVHRDIKPSNIMLTDDNQVKVVDFGLSLLSSRDADGNPGLAGTPSYIAPELVDGGAASRYTDLYSLTVLLYEMILGELPFPGEDAHAVLYKVINSEPQAISATMPIPLRNFLLRGLSKDPAQRIASCAEYAQQLSALQTGLDRLTSHSLSHVEQLKQAQVFAQCDSDILYELAACCDIETSRSDELMFTEVVADEYLCLLEGKALLVAADKHIMFSVGQWLTEKTPQQWLGAYQCKALSNTSLLRVSKSKLLTCTPATQAYFFGFILERIILQ